MIVSDLLKDYSGNIADNADKVEILTYDHDFGATILVDIVSIDNLLNDAEFINYRIATVRKWWLKRVYFAEIHPVPYDMQIHIMIEL